MNPSQAANLQMTQTGLTSPTPRILTQLKDYQQPCRNRQAEREAGCSANAQLYHVLSSAPHSDSKCAT